MMSSRQISISLNILPLPLELKISDILFYMVQVNCPDINSESSGQQNGVLEGRFTAVHTLGHTLSLLVVCEPSTVWS
jgi:hypothetical protein